MLEMVLTNENISNTSKKLSYIDSEDDKECKNMVLPRATIYF